VQHYRANFNYRVLQQPCKVVVVFWFASTFLAVPLQDGQLPVVIIYCIPLVLSSIFELLQL